MYVHVYKIFVLTFWLIRAYFHTNDHKANIFDISDNKSPFLETKKIKKCAINVAARVKKKRNELRNGKRSRFLLH